VPRRQNGVVSDISVEYGTFFISEEAGGILQFEVGSYRCVLGCRGQDCDQLGFWLRGMDVAP